MLEAKSTWGELREELTALVAAYAVPSGQQFSACAEYLAVLLER
jgi:hypothetical protein